VIKIAPILQLLFENHKFYLYFTAPNEWYTSYPIARTGKRQSPIDIKAEDQHQVWKLVWIL